MTMTITVFERAFDEGRGLARDMRVRWALEEVGQAYEVRLVPWEKFNRTTSTPDRMSRTSVSASPVEGPSVLTIFVFPWRCSFTGAVPFVPAGPLQPEPEESSPQAPGETRRRPASMASVPG